MSFAEQILAFRAAFQPRVMKRDADYEDQLRQMVPEDGLVDLELRLADGLKEFPTVAEEPRDEDAAKVSKVLWVVGAADAPVALELCDWGRRLESKAVKHSNLTGGAPAHSGGELWIVEGEGVVVNAGSGRYGADDEPELDAFVEVLRSMGLRVASMGFDIDTPGQANRIAVGPLNWLEPHD